MATGLPTSDGAGVKLTRLIGTPALPDLDPFLMLDAFGSDDPKAYIAGFPDHPHRGFETVTYMLAGRLRHRDNKGNSGLLEAGSVQWMTAGRGIVHSEMPEQEQGLMSGFQLWINLPAKDKMIEPRYQDIAPARIPGGDGAGRGEGQGDRRRLRGHARARGAGLRRRRSISMWRCPPVHSSRPRCRPSIAPSLMSMRARPRSAPKDGRRFWRRARSACSVPASASSPAAPARRQGCCLVAGRPLKEPVAKYGPFVMNTEAELYQAFADYDAGRL